MYNLIGCVEVLIQNLSGELYTEEEVEKTLGDENPYFHDEFLIPAFWPDDTGKWVYTYNPKNGDKRSRTLR